MRSFPIRLGSALAVLSLASAVTATDWPQWGGGPTRNPVSTEKGLPLDFRFATDTEKERGITWKADLNGRTVIPPAIADGLVWAGTAARYQDDEKIPRKDWDGGVLKCFRESDGKLLWEHRSPRLSGKDINWVEDFPSAALGSAPLVEGDRLWYVNNRTEVVCFDIGPLKKGTGKPTEAWKLDLRKQLKVFPYLPGMQFGFAASVGGYKDKLYVVTHHSVDVDQTKVPAPDAPSLVCLEKATGKVLWTDNSPGKDILEHQVSSPLVVEIKGKAQVIVGQGDGWLRSFDAETGKLLWKCDLNPKDAVWRPREPDGRDDRNYVVATPILYDGRVYAVTGREVMDGFGPAALFCIDPTKKGDISLELPDGPRKGKPNPNSGVVWHTPRKVPDDAPRIEVGKTKKADLLRSRAYYFGRSIAGCVAHDGLLYAAEASGRLYCFDAKTGKLHWADDLKSSIYGQLLWADGKVLVTTDSGELFANAHGKEAKRLLKVEGTERFHAGPVFANGTLYLTGENTLYAIRAPK